MNKKQITYFMQKTSSYKNYHADGIFGGLTPKGLIHIGFFLERNAIPTEIVHELNKKLEIGKEIDKKGKEGIVREIECGVMIDVDTAKKMVDWLNDRISQFEKVVSAQEKSVKNKGNKK